MSGPSAKQSFAARPGDPDRWIKSADGSVARGQAASTFTARLTIDVNLNRSMQRIARQADLDPGDGML